MGSTNSKNLASNKMSQRLELETKGEKATNRLRLFLSIIFTLAVAAAFMSGSLGGTFPYFFGGVALYTTSF
ncbi:MAG: hypothetical protein ACFFG0_48825, partial [Candidatus Thorarchaeota archaeon]